ncbi:MAG: hypothetical protein ACR2F2_05395 [Pyrinomonadaceae bacterium]
MQLVLSCVLSGDSYCQLEYGLALETRWQTETRELFQSEAAHKFVEKMHCNEKIRHGETV